MQKGTIKKIGSADKIIHFWWIVSLIPINEEEISWEVGVLGVTS